MDKVNFLSCSLYLTWCLYYYFFKCCLCLMFPFFAICVSFLTL
jgi:hypothetical protein